MMHQISKPQLFKKFYGGLEVLEERWNTFESPSAGSVLLPFISPEVSITRCVYRGPEGFQLFPDWRHDPSVEPFIVLAV